MSGAGDTKRAGLTAVWLETAGLPTVSRQVFVLQLVQQALRSVLLSPVAFGACLVTVSFTLLGAFLLLIGNAGGALEAGPRGVVWRIYLREGTGTEAVDALSRELSTRDGVRSVVYVSKEEALSEFREALHGQSDLLAGLETENPLPASVKISMDGVTEEAVQSLVQEYARHPAAEYVQHDQEFLRKVGSVVALFRRAAQLSVVFMLLVTAVIIANTVRLTASLRRDEISIMRLVGASSAFVKAPCVIEGVLHGFVGGIVSMLLLYGAWRVLLQALRGIPLWETFFPALHFVSAWTLCAVILGAAIVGALASLFAVRKVAEQ